MVESLVGIEREAFLWLNSLQSDYLDSVMYLISDKWPWIIFVVLFLILCSVGQKRGEVLLLILSISFLVLVADGISSGIIKEIFQRERPTYHPLTEDVVKVVMDHRGSRLWICFWPYHQFFCFCSFRISCIT